MRRVFKTLFVGSLVALLAYPAFGQTQCTANAQAGGTANAITVPLLPCGLATNVLILTLSAPNTGPVTLQMTGYAALPFVDAGGNPLAAGVLSGAGVIALVTGTGTQWRLLQLPGVTGPTGPTGPPGPVGPAGSGVLPTVVVEDSGTTIDLSAGTQVLVVDKTVPSATAVVLPAVSNWPDCLAGTENSCPYVYVKDGGGNAGSYPITVTTADGATIDGGSSIVLGFDWQAGEFVLDPTGKWSQL